MWRSPRVMALVGGCGSVFHATAFEWDTDGNPFDQDIYGQNIKVLFHSKIRDEMKFYSVDALVKQFELAKIDEAKGAGGVQLVDVALPPEKGNKPSVVVTALLAGVAGVSMAIFFFFVRHSRVSGKVSGE